MRINRISLLLVLFIFIVTSPLLKSDSVYNLSARSHEPIILINNSYPVHNLNTVLDYQTIQGAIDANETQDGHVILVDAGIYYEHVSVGKKLTLIGENKDNTVIDGNGTGKVVQLSTRANVAGFTIRNGDYGVWARPGFGYTPIYVGFVLNDNYIVDNNYGGIHLELCGGNTVANNVVANNTLFGIHLYHAGNNSVSNNTVLNNGHGIDFYGNSNDNILRNNNMTDNEYNFGLILRGETRDFLYAAPSNPGIVNDVDSSNTVDGKPIIYWINQHNQQVPANAGYVMLINSTNILIEGLNLSKNVQNIFLLASNNTVIVNSSMTNSIYGIDVRDYGWFDYNTSIFHSFYSFNTTVKGNMLVDNGVGIRIRSDNSTMSNNTLYRNPLGICLTGTSNSTISRNLVVASDLSPYPGPLYIFYYPEEPWERSRELMMLEIGGIIVGGDDNVVCGNTVTDSWLGISMCDEIRRIMGSRNVIFNNNFINNTGYQAMGWRRCNYWNNDYPAGGNYWTNYNGTDFFSGPNQTVTGSDGIGDEPFLVFPLHGYEVLDDYPLMAPISVFDVGSWNGVNRDISIISNSTISNFQLNKTQKIISFNVTAETGLGFCRVTIPNVIVQDFWYDNYTVLINGQPVESRNWRDEGNTYIYFTYQHSTHKVTIIPEFPSNIVLALLMTLSLITCILAKRKFVEL